METQRSIQSRSPSGSAASAGAKAIHRSIKLPKMLAGTGSGSWRPPVFLMTVGVLKLSVILRGSRRPACALL